VYIFEFSSDTWNNFTAGDKFWASLFQTITPRTAGFNTVNLAKMSQVSTAVTIILMLIGGSPGSTAGGMKTTTLAVMVASGFSVFKRKNDTEAFHRRIPIETVRHASAVFLMYISLLLFGGLVIAQIEGIDVLTCLYETASAIGTVGLTLGITPSLHESSKLILILLMYIGRVGGLILVFAAMNPHKNRIKYPQEQITVG
ncbi:MAG: Trk family potassium uptake protein, partial [Clostridiales bacterium]|nr:Trk family potassium uptake protein [Clostridiales bacterium]